LALAAALVWLGHHRRIRPWGLFALYVAGYSAYRIFEETIRIDSSEHLLGLRLNFYVATIMTLIGIGWFILAQRRNASEDPASPAGSPAAADELPATPADTEDLPGRDGDELAPGAHGASEPDGVVSPGGAQER
ncbi:MAG: prolipoprotein diacylglyceryl transferase family protein, partial [Streptosporangiaceae bacterium]